MHRPGKCVTVLEGAGPGKEPSVASFSLGFERASIFISYLYKQRFPERNYAFYKVEKAGYFRSKA